MVSAVYERLPSGVMIAGRYRVIASLGHGGMGAVYRVVDETSGRELALKKLDRPRGKPTSERELRFRREFHTIAGLAHPRVITVYDYGVADDGPFYTMELLDGEDLSAMGPVTPVIACHLLRDVAAALAFIHDRRLLHRDVTPANVRCTSDGRAKLIDFGILATIGVCGEICGTPPYMAPETLRGLPLDRSADIFGLGALAYRLLTGQNAFAVKRVDELEPAWRAPPPRPSAIANDVPAALDALVMSMLSIDPLGRPATAGEVIDRLTAIGSLEPLAEIEAARGYLSSAALVGRKPELTQLRRVLDAAKVGRGQAVVIEAPSGTGKSRLLRELGLEAQLAGTAVLRVDSTSAGRGPYGLLRALVDELATQVPESLDELRRRAPLLGRVFPSLAELVGPIDVAEAPADPNEGRREIQAGLSGLFVEIANQRALTIIVDDLQRSDEASAAVLAGLALAASTIPLLLAAAVRTDETERAPVAIATLRDHAARIRLGGFDRDEVDDMVRGLFGDVPNAGRLAAWIYRIAGGSPLHGYELVRRLVDRRVIRFADGIWVLPEEIDANQLPAWLADAMELHVVALSPGSRAAAEALSIFGSDFSLEEIALAVEERREEQLFAALDELLAAEVLVGSGTRYRFRHDGLREAFLRRLDDPRRRALHRWVGEALLKRGSLAPDREAEVGWHLLHGGDRSAGAVLLERAGRRLFGAQSFFDAIPLLEAALEVYDAEHRAPRVVLALRHMLLMSGCLADRATAARHKDAAVAGFGRYSGVALARRLRPRLGRHLALTVGFSWAVLRWLFALPSRRGPNPMDALRTFFIVAGYATSLHTMSYDVEGARRLVREIAPIPVFEGRIPYAVYLMIHTLVAVIEGRQRTARSNARLIIDILERDRLTPIAEFDRKTGDGASHFILAVFDVMDQNVRYLAEVDALTRLEMPFFAVGAIQSRVNYHRFRGEEQIAATIATELEVLYVQLGSAWSIAANVPLTAAIAYGLTRDIVGLKRTIETLDHLSRAGLSMQPFRDLAIGEYRRELGELDESHTALVGVIEHVHGESPLAEMPAHCALAETLLARGDADGAAAAAQRALAWASEAEYLQPVIRLRASRALALAEAAAGDVNAAMSRLERALTEAAPLASPTISGALHEAAARTALCSHDERAFEHHRQEAERWFAPTRNPALIARIHALAAARHRDVRAGDTLRVVGKDAVTSMHGGTAPTYTIPRDDP